MSIFDTCDAWIDQDSDAAAQQAAGRMFPFGSYLKARDTARLSWNGKLPSRSNEASTVSEQKLI